MEKERKKRKPFKKLMPFTDAQRSLMAEWYSWAMQYADTEINRRAKKKDKIPAWVIEDAAVNALIHAAVKWDPEQGVSFKTYYHKGFYMAVWNAVKDYCESRDNHISENTPIFSGSKRNDDDVLRLKDTEPFSNDSFEDSMCDKIDVDRMLSKLTPLQSEAVRRFFIGGERQSEIASDMGVTRQNVNNAVSTAVRYMRLIYNGEIDRVRRGRRKKNAGTENKCS
ncbi:MAG: sigma-70 family RNA polymerase sigma factor [Bacteroidales bacterium]|nr:sigma-70 family RNA polymerase sigma factor [Bacteroidales bacterium]